MFLDICFLIKQLQAAIMLYRDIWNIIAIVIIVYSLYAKLETVTKSISELGYKIIDEIQ